MRLKTILFLICVLPSGLFSQPYFPVRVNKLWGAMDSTGKVIIKPGFDQMYVYGPNNNYLSAFKGDSVFLFNSRLSIVAKTSYSAIIEHGEGMFQTKLRSKSHYPSFYGLMDSSGNVILEPKFCLMEPFSDGVAKVNIYIDTIDNKPIEKSGIIDKSGNWIVPPIYEKHHLKSSSEGLVNFYQIEKGWGAMNTKGEIIIQPKYTLLGPCKNGHMEYGLKEKYGSGLMKRDETVTIPDDGKHVTSYRPESPTDTLVVVHAIKRINSDYMPYRYIDSKIYTISGKYLFESPYGAECSQQCNGFFQVSNEKMKRGMMNSSGKIVTKPSYNVLQWSQKDLKQVSLENKWGYIDNTGAEVIPCIYDDTKPFDNGLAAIYIGGKWSDYIFPDRYANVKMGYIDRTGKIIWEPSW